MKNKNELCLAMCFLMISYALDSRAESINIPNSPISSDEQIERWIPQAGVTWQIQLQGRIITSYNVDIYVIDLFDSPQSIIDELHSKNKKVVCYFSGGSWEDWREDAIDFPESVIGSSNGWAGENWLDIRQIDILKPIMDNRMDLAVSKNCDAVDVDNVDGYSNETGLPLEYQDQINYNLMLAESAHERGLSISLKNDLGQVNDLVDHFDFAINESCHVYNECEMLLPFIEQNKAVLGIEYSLNKAKFCPNANALGMSFMKKRTSLKSWMDPCW